MECEKEIEKKGNKNGKPTSHRYNRLPLLPSGPGGIQQELVVPICRCKGKQMLLICKQPIKKNCKTVFIPLNIRE